jgi:hypothetical protein
MTTQESSLLACAAAGWTAVALEAGELNDGIKKW